MGTLWMTILGLFSGIVSLVNKALDFFKTSSLINRGKVLEQAEQAKREAELERETTKIILENRTKEDTIKRMDEGSF